MEEPTAVFLDYDPDPRASASNFAAEARFGLVQFRKRPPDSTCQHPLVDFGKPEKRGAAIHVDVLCMGCGHGWQQVKVLEPKGEAR